MKFGRGNGLLKTALFSAAWASLIGQSVADLKGVFAHYMVRLEKPAEFPVGFTTD